MGGKRRHRDREDDGYEDIMRKLRKLEKEVKKKRTISSSGSDDEELDYQLYDDISMEVLDNENEIQDTSIAPGPPAPPAPPAPPVPPAPGALTSDAAAQNNDELLIDDTQQPEQDALDQDVLDILGDDPSTENPFGESLHKDIASRWQNILAKGLNKDNRTALLKLYLPAENCSYMKAPKLNAEIKAALAEANNKKDSQDRTSLRAVWLPLEKF